MAMFEDFTFDAARSPSLGSDSAMTRATSRSVSPCSAQSPFPAPSFTVTDLAAQFGSQRIRKDSSICYDPCDAYANNDDDDGWVLPPIIEQDSCAPLPRTTTIPRPHSPSRRFARQMSTRLLCTSTHQNDIAALVARLVDSDQCNILPANSLTPPPQSPEDEGYDSGESPVGSRRGSVTMTNSTTRHKLDYRRASDLSKTSSCISKTVRIRKDRDSSSRKRGATKQ